MGLGEDGGVRLCLGAERKRCLVFLSCRAAVVEEGVGRSVIDQA